MDTISGEEREPERTISARETEMKIISAEERETEKTFLAGKREMEIILPQERETERFSAEIISTQKRKAKIIISAEETEGQNTESTPAVECEILPMEVEPPMQHAPFPFCSESYYVAQGTLAAKNLARDEIREQRPPVLDSTGKLLSMQRGSVSGSLQDNIKALEIKLKHATNIQEISTIEATIMVAKKMLHEHPMYSTRDALECFETVKNSSLMKKKDKQKDKQSQKRMPTCFFEVISRHLNIIQIYVHGQAYIVAGTLHPDASNFISKMETLVNEQQVVNDFIVEKAEKEYSSVREMLTSKTDRDLLALLMTKLTSVNFVTDKLHHVQNKGPVRRFRDAFPDVQENFSDFKRKCLVVRDDMTGEQQRRLTRRLQERGKHKILNVRKPGSGRLLKSTEFPELSTVLEAAFGQGAEIHPRLTEGTHFRAPDCAMIMRQAQELLEICGPPNFSISLSTCYTYTQNYKSKTHQAKRHHSSKPEVNAKVSLKPLPRVGVRQEVINLHYSSANANYYMDMAANDNNIMIDAKDAKAIVCGDIEPVLHPDKSWREKTYPDHTWNQSRLNAVTPMTHLFLTPPSDQVVSIGDSSYLHVTRTGRAVTLVNLSYFEPETAFNCMNEIFYLMTLPQLDSYFRSPETGRLKDHFIFVVDNGPSEAPSNIAVQMCMTRLVNVLHLKKCVQVSFAEYHSKRNPAERPHAEENRMLSRHGPFQSDQVHQSVEPGSQEHKENMNKMAQDVISCFRGCTFGGQPFLSFRGVTKETSLFCDCDQLKHFLALSEKRKIESFERYFPNDNEVANILEHVWNADITTEGSYKDDFQHINNTLESERTAWCDKYVAAVYTKDLTVEVKREELQPVPDYLRWCETTELHYLSLEARQALADYLDNSSIRSGFFLPTRLLDVALRVFSDPTSQQLQALAVLAWLPVSSTSEYMRKAKQRMEESFQDDIERDTWSQHPLYRKSKTELEAECKKAGMQVDRLTKHKLVKQLANHEDTGVEDVEPLPEYKGDLSAVPSTMSALSKLQMSYLKKILKCHGVHYDGTKAELVLWVMLLKSKRSYLLFERERVMITEAVYMAKDLIFAQKRMKLDSVANVYRQRSNPGYDHPNDVALQDGSSACTMNNMINSSKSKIPLPARVTEENLHDVFKPLEEYISNSVRVQKEVRTLDDMFKQSKDEEVEECDDVKIQDQGWQIGAKLQVRFTKEDLDEISPWNPGWYTAEVQSYNYDTDIATIIYLSQPHITYEINVAELQTVNKVRELKGSDDSC